MEAITKVPEMLEHASDDLKGDAEFIVEALKLGCSLGHASPALRRDKDVVLTAVEHHIEGLMFASENLQRDRCVCRFPTNMVIALSPSLPLLLPLSLFLSPSPYLFFSCSPYLFFSCSCSLSTSFSL
jgi:hypothetical protein